jgi:hypothetical protein
LFEIIYYTTAFRNCQGRLRAPDNLIPPGFRQEIGASPHLQPCLKGQLHNALPDLPTMRFQPLQRRLHVNPTISKFVFQSVYYYKSILLICQGLI